MGRRVFEGSGKTFKTEVSDVKWPSEFLKDRHGFIFWTDVKLCDSNVRQIHKSRKQLKLYEDLHWHFNSYSALSKAKAHFICLLENATGFFHVLIFICCQSLSCCSFEESDPTVSVTRKQNTQITKNHQSRPHNSKTHSSFKSNSPVWKQGWSLVPVVLPHPHRSAPLSGPAGSLASALFFMLSAIASGVGGAAVCGHPHCLQLGWMVAQHCKPLSATEGPFCFTRNTGLHTLSTMTLFTVSLHNEAEGVGCIREGESDSNSASKLNGDNYWPYNKRNQ